MHSIIIYYATVQHNMCIIILDYYYKDIHIIIYEYMYIYLKIILVFKKITYSKRKGKNKMIDDGTTIIV